MKSDINQLKSRGYVEDEDLLEYRDKSKEELFKLLQSKTPIERTIASKLLIKYKDTETMLALIRALLKEKKLYTKIALSESVSVYGEEASEVLIKHLGQVGKNQHGTLPKKKFGKKNYPLPRDIIARTICKIGTPALKHLRLCLKNSEYHQMLEAIDAIGFISFYAHNEESFDDLIDLFNRYESDDLMIWKLIRSLQGFTNEKSIEILNNYIESSIIQHKWEAERSLEQIRRIKVENNRKSDCR